MVYLYENAIIEDLVKSFNPDAVNNPVVKVFGTEEAVGVAAQLQEDKIKLPIVILRRDGNYALDTDRSNFTRMKKGVPCVFDNKTNTLYYEKAMPIKLSYKLSVMSSNTVDVDELMKELIFKYNHMYYLTIKLPYESDRRIRFGIVWDQDQGIESVSGSFDYVQSGKLYESEMTLRCEGCVLVSYTPVHLKRTEYEVTPISNNRQDLV